MNSETILVFLQAHWDFVSGSVNLHNLDSYHTPSRRIRVTAGDESEVHMDAPNNAGSIS